MKFSQNFERDYAWFMKWKHKFDFDGNGQYLSKKGQNIIKPDPNGKTAKECFYIWDSQGKIEGCREPELLHDILKCKGSINFMIKMWAEDRAPSSEGFVLLPRIEFGKIAKECELLDWMIEGVEEQKFKYGMYKKLGGREEIISGIKEINGSLWADIYNVTRIISNNNKLEELRSKPSKIYWKDDRIFCVSCNQDLEKKEMMGSTWIKLCKCLQSE